MLSCAEGADGGVLVFAAQGKGAGSPAGCAIRTPYGKLRVYDLAPAWKEVASFDAVPAFDCAYGATTPPPSRAVIGDNAFVSDPTSGRIREYNLGTLKQELEMPVGGQPANLAPSEAYSAGAHRRPPLPAPRIRRFRRKRPLRVM